MKSNISKIASILNENDNFIIVTHVRPDGDAIGSSLGLLSALLDNGKKATAYFNEPLPINFKRFIPEESVIIDSKAPDYSKYSKCITLDASSSTRIAFGDSFDISKLPIPLVVIDHHPDNSIEGEFSLVVPDAAATAQIIFNLLIASNFKISKFAATHLLMGIIMDTGCFRFDNTSPEVHRCSAQLLELGADQHNIINSMYFTKPMNHILFEAELVVNELKLSFNGKFAWIYISEEMISKHAIDMKNSDGLIDKVREINGVEIAALLHKQESDFKVSLRSKRLDYSVGKIARVLGGGGHELAAGASIKASNHHEAEQILIEEVRRIIE